MSEPVSSQKIWQRKSADSDPNYSIGVRFPANCCSEEECVKKFFFPDMFLKKRLHFPSLVIQCERMEPLCC